MILACTYYCYANCDFIFPSLLLHLFIWKSTASKSCPFPHFFIHLFIFISMDSRIFILFHGFYLICCSNVQDLAMINSFKLVPVSFQHAHPQSIFRSRLFSGTTRFSRLISYFPCLNPGISHFSKDPVPFSRE